MVAELDTLAQSAAAPSRPARVPSLATVALGTLAASVGKDARDVPALAHAFEALHALPELPGPQLLAACLRTPAPDDRLLASLAATLALTPVEVLAVTLALAVEEDPRAGRAVAFLQAPIGGSRPTLGLLVSAFAAFGGPHPRAALHHVAAGMAVRSGLLEVATDPSPLPERSIAVPLPLCLALRGQDAIPPGVSLATDGAEVALPPSVLHAAERHAEVLAADPRRVLVIRGGSAAEARAVAGAIAAALGRRAAVVTSDGARGLAPWLHLCRAIPTFPMELGPGERRLLPALPCYDGPAIVLTGPEGSVASAAGSALSWRLEVPTRDERRALWERALGDPALADDLASEHRHGSGRIAHLARIARHKSALEGRAAPNASDVAAASWVGEGAGLEGLAQPLEERIVDEALVVPAALRGDLQLLLQRCRSRDGLANGLGPSATARYRPGVRVLFVGPSGTGKTLAAGWLASRLGLPLYRVDLAGVTSKYIGETEKNLAQLLSRAEHAEVVLLFDEADSMFGKRTDVKEANDRFANAQTNYLLQRIETFEGIALLTSNSVARFDSAFTRRLDMVLEFAPPSPEERRQLWDGHLGGAHSLTARQVNQLAALTDLSGGQIRNVVLTAAVLARAGARAIALGDVLAGLEGEYRKAGKLVPMELRTAKPRLP